MADHEDSNLRKAFLIGSMRNAALRAEEVIDRERTSADLARRADPKASVLGAGLAVAGRNAVVSLGLLFVFAGVLMFVLGAGVPVSLVLVAVGAVLAVVFSGSRR